MQRQNYKRTITIIIISSYRQRRIQSPADKIFNLIFKSTEVKDKSKQKTIRHHVTAHYNTSQLIKFEANIEILNRFDNNIDNNIDNKLKIIFEWTNKTE